MEKNKKLIIIERIKKKSGLQINVTAHNFSQLSQSANIICKPVFIPCFAHFKTHLILKSRLKTFCYI